MTRENGLCELFEGGLITCDECGGCGHYWDPDWPAFADDGWWFECPACSHEAAPASVDSEP